MKTIVQTLPVLALLVTFTSCTAYVDPGVTAPATTTTTTRTTADSPYLPGASVTTEETTTRY